MSGDNGSRLAFPYFGDAGVHEGGMTKREYFAAMAMQGMLANLVSLRRAGFKDHEIEEFAAIRANGLLAELERSNDR